MVVEDVCCVDCNTDISGGTNIPFADNALCEECYSKRNFNTCTNCNDYIGFGSVDVEVRDNHYHKDCFICSKCRNLLQNGDFSHLDDNLICHDCRGVDSEKSKYCHSCMKGYAKGDMKVAVSGEYFHEECFCCSQCEEPIKEQKFIKKDGQQICNNCFDAKFAKVCDFCDVRIKGPIVTLDQRYFHANCFVCYNCKEHLEVWKEDEDGHDEQEEECNEQHDHHDHHAHHDHHDHHNETSEEEHDNQHRDAKAVRYHKQDGEPYCTECWLELFAKRCIECTKPLPPKSHFVEYHDKLWHKECFTCCVCECELADGVQFVSRAEFRFCINCK